MESCCVCLDGRLQTIAVNYKNSVKDLLQLMKCDTQSYLVYSIPLVFLWAGLSPTLRDHTPLSQTEPLSAVAESGHVIVILKSCDLHVLPTDSYTEVANKSHNSSNLLTDSSHVTNRSHDLGTRTDETPIVTSHDCHVTSTSRSLDWKMGVQTRRSRRLRLCANNDEPIVISDGNEDDGIRNQDKNENEDCYITESPQSDDSFTIEQYTMTKQDMDTLRPGNWLNDKVINGYMKLLMDQYKDEVYITSSFFYTKLSTHGFNGIIRWLKKVRLLDYLYVIIPLHMNGNHWTLLCMDIRKKLMCYYDSMGCKGEKVVKSVKRMMCKYMKTMCDTKDTEHIKKKWTVLYVKTPVQHNCNDCGVFMCQYARYICENIGKRFEAMPCFVSKRIRLKMASELRKKSLL